MKIRNPRLEFRRNSETRIPNCRLAAIETITASRAINQPSLLPLPSGEGRGENPPNQRFAHRAPEPNSNAPASWSAPALWRFRWSCRNPKRQTAGALQDAGALFRAVHAEGDFALPALVAPKRSEGGFTLIELLAVISIIGILAAIVVPNIGKFLPNKVAGAEQQLLAELARARQLAISQRTTVYMVFVPTNFFRHSGDGLQPAYYTGLNINEAAYNNLLSYPTEIAKASRLLDKQMIGYTFVSLKTLGDQPGQNNPRYLAPWRTLPEGAYIPLEKFGPRFLPPSPANSLMTITNLPSWYYVVGFTNILLPFPSEQSNVAFYLPCIAFNYLGQLVSGIDEIIPLAKGNVVFARNSDKTPAANAPTIQENPPGSATNAYDLVKIDWLTGRAHAERLEIR